MSRGKIHLQIEVKSTHNTVRIVVDFFFVKMYAC